jgi:hypothetical protein
MIYTFIARASTDLPVAACCRVMKVSTSGFYSWQGDRVRHKDLDDAYLSNNSSGSKPGTTRNDDIATARCSIPWTTKPRTRHDQQPTTTTVRWSGGSSESVTPP